MSQSISDSALRPSTGQSDASDSSDMVEDTGKRRWGIFRSLMPGSSKTRSKSRSPDPPSGKLVRTQSAMSQATGSAPSTSSAAASPSQPDTPQASTHRTFCFKFSLEWVDKRFQTPGNARLFPPRLPMPAQKFLQAQQGTPPNTMPVKPQEMPSTQANTPDVRLRSGRWSSTNVRTSLSAARTRECRRTGWLRRLHWALRPSGGLDEELDDL